MNMGETIKRLRKQKDMTQEQLAEYLNLTPQAISRWEVNAALPDITAIPLLANIFDVTTDHLLGVDIDAKDKRIEEIRWQSDNCVWEARYDEGLSLLRAGLKEFPNSHVLMDNLASLLSLTIGNYNRDCTEEEKRSIDAQRKHTRDEIIALCEKNLATSTDDFIRHSAIYTLCTTYTQMGEMEKAQTYAKKMPNRHWSSDNMMTHTLTGTAKFEHIQRGVVHHLLDLFNEIGFLMGTTLDDGTQPFTDDESIALYHMMVDMIAIFMEQSSLGDFDRVLADLHSGLSRLYFHKKDMNASAAHFKRYAQHAIAHEALPPVNQATQEYTCLLLRGMKFPLLMCHLPWAIADHILETLQEREADYPAADVAEIKKILQ